MKDADIAVTCDGAIETQKCTRVAVYVVTKHRLGHCNLSLNIVRILCPKCTAAVLQTSAFDQSISCTRCGRIFHELHELVDTAHLVTGASLDA